MEMGLKLIPKFKLYFIEMKINCMFLGGMAELR